MAPTRALTTSIPNCKNSKKIAFFNWKWIEKHFYRWFWRELGWSLVSPVSMMLTPLSRAAPAWTSKQVLIAEYLYLRINERYLSMCPGSIVGHYQTLLWADALFNLSVWLLESKLSYKGEICSERERGKAADGERNICHLNPWSWLLFKFSTSRQD